MNIKAIPAAGINTVKETSEDQTPGGGSKDSKPRREDKHAKEGPLDTEESLSPQAGDDSLRASQPIDSNTVVNLLSQRPKTRGAKFPTPGPSAAKAASVKKLNRSA